MRTSQTEAERVKEQLSCALCNQKLLPGVWWGDAFQPCALSKQSAHLVLFVHLMFLLAIVVAEGAGCRYKFSISEIWRTFVLEMA